MKLKNSASFEEREQSLKWAVEEMRSEVLEHLEASEVYQDMTETQKMHVLQQIDGVHHACKDELFQMHKDQADGKYVEKTPSFAKLLQQIESLKNKIQIVEAERELLGMLQAHNEKVDRFTRRFSQNDLLLSELSKLPQFQTEEEQVLPDGAAGSLDKDYVKQLDQMRQEAERLEYLEANMS